MLFLFILMVLVMWGYIHSWTFRSIESIWLPWLIICRKEALVYETSDSVWNSLISSHYYTYHSCFCSSMFLWCRLWIPCFLMLKVLEWVLYRNFWTTWRFSDVLCWILIRSWSQCLGSTFSHRNRTPRNPNLLVTQKDESS